MRGLVQLCFVNNLKNIREISLAVKILWSIQTYSIDQTLAWCGSVGI